MADPFLFHGEWIDRMGQWTTSDGISHRDRLFDPNLSEAAITDGSGTSYLVGEIADRPTSGFNTICVLGYNFAATDTVRVRAADTQANLTAAPALDTTAVEFQAIGGYDGLDARYAGNVWTCRLFFSAVDQPWWMIDFTGANRLVGRIYLDNDFRPLTGYIDLGYSAGYDDGSVIVDSMAGQAAIISARPARLVQATWRDLTNFEVNELQALIHMRGEARDVFFIKDIGLTGVQLHQNSVYGLLTSLRPIETPLYDVNDMPMTVREIVPSARGQTEP